MRSPRRQAITKAAAAIVVFLACYSCFVRPELLSWGATDDEAGGAWPGQELMEPAGGRGVAAGSVRSISMAAKPGRVWPWLAQVGQTRGGFYSHTWLENLAGCEMTNANRIHPEWQHLHPGDKVYLAPPSRFGGGVYLVAARVEPPLALVLVSPPDWAALRAGGRASRFVWSFELRDAPGGGTRLTARSAGHMGAAEPLLEPAHFVMELAMLQGLRRRAEWPGSGSEAKQVDYHPVCEGGLCGYADNQGAMRVAAKFVEAGPFEHGMAVVATRVVAELGGPYVRRYGVIDCRGAYRIAPRFRYISHFREGTAVASVDGRTFGYIDREGTWVLPPGFAEAGDFQNGLATVLPAGGLGFGQIDTEGRFHSNTIGAAE